MKEKKPQTLESRMTSLKVNIVLWSINAVIWVGLGIARFITDDTLWIAIVNLAVGALSIVDVILNVLNLNKLKKEKAAQAEKTEE